MKTIIIAEAGVNHNGDFDIAARLVTSAARIGADYIKFQTFKAEKLTTPAARRAAYQERNLEDGDLSQYNMLKRLEIPDEWYPMLIQICRSNGIKFLSSAFDIESVDFLADLEIDCFKIPSGEITNLPYLRRIAQKKRPVILSTGMATLEEIRWALRLFTKSGLQKKNITLLHCNTEYPTPLQDVNLKAMVAMRDEFRVKVGYSDHTEGITVPIAAVALGASVIEKHFTIDRTLPGPDHKASLPILRRW
jgi:sialic acid synthase SpsE